MWICDSVVLEVTNIQTSLLDMSSGKPFNSSMSIVPNNMWEIFFKSERPEFFFKTCFSLDCTFDPIGPDLT